MRIIFMGTPEFAVPTLAALCQVYDVVHVYTQPPRPAGRGYHVTQSPVQVYAEQKGIPVSHPTTLKTPEAQKAFVDIKADLAIVVAYGLLLPPEILAGTRLGCINIHGSLLPRWRGAAPIQRAMMAGDTETGICIMQMEAGLDTGPVFARASVPILAHTTFLQLHDALSELGARTLLEVLPDIFQQVSQAQVQLAEGVTYAHRLTREDGLIQWSQSAVMIDRQVRALNPWPGTWCYVRGERLKIHAVELGETMLDVSLAPSSLTPQPGMIVDHNMTVACGEGALRVLQVQLAGGRSMSAADFMRGHRLQPGDVLI